MGFTKKFAFPCLLLIAFLGSCSLPAVRFDEKAASYGFERSSVAGAGFVHVVYRNQYWGDPGPLHVYLEGDGTPFINRYFVSADPTPRNPLVLQMMTLDDAPALYLGRPCYHGQAAAQSCSPLIWTAARYSQEVVASMAQALRTILDQSAYREIVLLGYSGGGTLAMLLAERLEQVKAVVTVAANLDVAGWAALHEYTPLHASLSPASRPPLPARIVQLHFAGGEDENVPLDLISAVAAGQRHAKVTVIDNFDHVCCWYATWPWILDQLKTAMRQDIAGVL